MSDKGVAAVYILDSFALLAYLQGEIGGDQVQEVLTQARQGNCRVLFPLINLGEMAYIIERSQGLEKAQEALSAIQQLSIEILPTSEERVLAAAHIKANHALSYADAFVVVAGQEMQGQILTGDPEFRQVEDLVQVVWLTK